MEHLLVWFSAFGANVGLRCRYQDESKLVVLILWCPQIGDADGDAYFWTFGDVDFNGDDNHDGCHVVRNVPGDDGDGDDDDDGDSDGTGDDGDDADDKKLQ